MKSSIIALSEKISVKKALISTLVFPVLLWLIDFSPIGVAGLLKITDGVGILDYESRYTADFAYLWLESMTEAGRYFHLTRIMPLDIIYPPSLMCFMFSWLSLILKKSAKEKSPLWYSLILPPIYLLLDWIENIGITAMLLKFPGRLDGIAVATGIVTSVKKAVVLLIIILFIIQLTVFLIRKIKGDADAKVKG